MIVNPGRPLRLWLLTGRCRGLLPRRGTRGIPLSRANRGEREGSEQGNRNLAGQGHPDYIVFEAAAGGTATPSN